jgi:hypothetical protein
MSPIGRIVYDPKEQIAFRADVLFNQRSSTQEIVKYQTRSSIPRETIQFSYRYSSHGACNSIDFLDSNAVQGLQYSDTRSPIVKKCNL